MLRHFFDYAAPCAEIRNIVIVGGGTAGWLTAGVIAAKHQAPAPARLHRDAGRIAQRADHRRRRRHLADDAPHAEEDRRVGDRILPRMRRVVQAGRAVRPLDHRRGRRRLLPPAHAAAAASARSTSRRTGWRGDGAQLLRHGHARRAGSATKGSRPRRSRRPNMRRTRTTPITSTPASSRMFLAAALLRARSACATCSPTSPRCVWTKSGDIASLDTEQGGEIEGDLFVDCTGFAALLIGERDGRAVPQLRRHLVLRHRAGDAGAL